MSAELKVVLPPGFAALAVLDRTLHAGRGIAPTAPRFAAGLHAVYLSVPEFVAAGRHCPVVFAEAEGGRWQPMMVTGIEAGQNLCVDAEGRWRADVYCPAYVRRYPFCAVRAPGGESKTVVCVDDSVLGAFQPALFEADGAESQVFSTYQRLIEEMETAGRQTDVFCLRLAELNLLEAFNADIRPTGSERREIAGMWRVNESRLNSLPAETLTELMRSGFLSRIYAHLMSLDNFQRLLALAVARTSNPDLAG